MNGLPICSELGGLNTEVMGNLVSSRGRILSFDLRDEGSSPSMRTTRPCGAVASILPCQGRGAGSIPVEAATMESLLR